MRIDFIDNMKAVGIILVIVGHLNFLVAPVLIEVIYSFHMPLFFFISGFLGWEKLKGYSIRHCITTCYRSYIKPYIVFFIISTFFFILALIAKGNVEHIGLDSFILIFKGFVLGTAGALNVNAVLWFFSAMFITVFASFLCSRSSKYIKTEVLLLGLAGLILLFGVPHQVLNLPWNIAILHITLFFFTLGGFLRPYILTMSEKKMKLMHWAILFVLVGISIYSVHINKRVDLASGVLGGSHSLFLLNAMSCIFLLLILSTQLRCGTVIRWLSNKSLVIFPTHIIAIQITTMFIILSGININDINVFASVFLYILSSLLFALILNFSLHKLIPQVIR